MISVRKGTTKRCRYGACKSDTRTRFKSAKENPYYFINFPKPCLEYRKKNIKTSAEVHIKTCSKCSKCNLWVKKCGRSDRGFKSIDNVTKDTYICSLHFYGESGPTQMNPDPLSYQEFQATKLGTSLCEYIKIEIEGENGPQKNDIENIETIQQVSTAYEEVYIFDDNLSYIEEKVLPNQSSEKNIMYVDTNNEGINKAIRTIQIQTDSKKMCNKLVQVKFRKNSALEKFIISIRSDEKKCFFYTSLIFEQIQALHRSLSPSCENLDYVGSRKIKNGSSSNDKNKLTSMQQLILVLLRLRMGYLIEDLAYRFDISTGLVSKICTTWIHFLYNEFSTQLEPLMCPSGKTIAETLPNDNKDDETLPNIFQSIKNIKVIEKKFRLLQSILPLNKHTITPKIIFVCASLVNFQEPIVFDEQSQTGLF
ncbi:uncharacterized protein [Diabrotica undecimpunctata]|uniref:uncharacterized protein isoform X2 n=1 Tax=Diabrotica undecimpunctata TaxID=50387 RepID=UPI003B63D82B